MKIKKNKYGDEIVYIDNFECLLHRHYPVKIKSPVLGVEFNCVTQAVLYSQAVYFGDREVAQAIRSASNPLSVSKYEETLIDRAPDKTTLKRWGLVLYPVLCYYNMLKFADDELRGILLDTRGIPIVEASMHPVYGIGYTVNMPGARDPDLWKTNLQGKALVDVRDYLDPVKYIPF